MEKYLIPAPSSNPIKVTLCHFILVPLMHMLLALMFAVLILARSHPVTILCGLFNR